MKPSSEHIEKNLAVLSNELKFLNYFDKQGVKRRKYLSTCVDCNVNLWLQKSKLNKQIRCKSCSAKVALTEEKREKISLTLRKKYQEDADYKRRVNNARFIPSGNSHWNWKGGVTPINQRTRTSEKGNAWKLAVLHRDNYSCRICNSKENLHAHHINSWSEFPEDRFILENGLTMCSSCHTLYHIYEKEVRRNQNQTIISEIKGPRIAAVDSRSTNIEVSN